MADERVEQSLQIWRGMARLVNELPREERQRYQREFARFAHDLRHDLGVVANAEALLRTDLQSLPDTAEMLDFLEILLKANTRAIATLDALIVSFGHQIHPTDSP